MTRAFQDFMKYFNFLVELVKRDFKRKYYKSVLGILWTILNPLMMMVVITIVFSTLFKRNIPNFPVYYLTGYVIHNFIVTTTRLSIGSVLGNGGLIRKIYIPKYMFCLSNVLVQFITLLFSLIPLFLVMIVTKAPFTKYALLFPIPLLYALVFTLGLSLILSTYGVYFRDLNHLYGIITMMWMYATPLFYPISIIPERFRFLWDLNPNYIFITIARNLMVDGIMPSQKMLIVATCYSVITLIMGIVVFQEKENKFFLHI